MTPRAYLSNIAPGWPVQRQEELLAALPGWPNVPTYVDVLSPAKRKAHAPASLIKRAELLRATLQNDEIILVSLACLAWEQSDFLDCVASASARNATIIALDTGRRIAPNASPVEIAAAAREFLSKRKAAKGGTPGYLASALKRAAAKAAAAEKIRNRWEQPTKLYPTDSLLAEADMCRNTANLYLGNRPDAQQAYRDRVTQARHVYVKTGGESVINK